MSALLVADDAKLVPIALAVNGRRVRLRVEPRTHLADVLREQLDLTGTHLGCEHGVCGACTVLLDGEPARACLAFAGGCDGAAVTTIEGLDEDEIAAELRAAFTREHALQCGYCTPGMIVAARDLVLRLPDADERRVRLGLSGNLCRCTGYVGIVRAVMAVLRERRSRGVLPIVAERALGPVGSHPAPPYAEDNAAGHSPRPHAEVLAAGGPRSTQDGGASFEGRSRGHLTVRSGEEDGAKVSLAQAVPDFLPAHSFEQTFAVPFPPDAVFALFGDVAAVASCLPGASLTAPPVGDEIEGAIRVRLGPIAAAFSGRARIARDPATRSGRIVGTGQDGGRSSTQGVVRYRVGAGDTPGHARVALSVGYTLTGPLAQFGRPGLVRDLAGRITAEFARNLEARLGGSVPAGPAGDISVTALLLTAFRDRIGGRLSRLATRFKYFAKRLRR